MSVDRRGSHRIDGSPDKETGHSVLRALVLCIRAMEEAQSARDVIGNSSLQILVR